LHNIQRLEENIFVIPYGVLLDASRGGQTPLYIIIPPIGIVHEGPHNRLIELLYADKLYTDALDIEAFLADKLVIEALNVDPLNMDALYIEALLADKLVIEALNVDPLNMDALYIEALLADKLVIEALNVEPLNMDALYIEALLDDKLVIEALYIEALLDDKLNIDALVADKLVIDEETSTIFKTFTLEKLFCPDQLLLEDNNFVPEFNDVVTNE
jgi:hypothetical protein